MCKLIVVSAFHLYLYWGCSVSYMHALDFEIESKVAICTAYSTIDVLPGKNCKKNKTNKLLNLCEFLVP